MGTWRVGERIDSRWEVLEIRQGGMGVLYIVRDDEWGIRLAAKGLQDRLLAANPLAAARFVREAEVWVGLDCHPNVAQAILVREILGQPLIFLEFVETDLANWIASGRLSGHLAQALDYAIMFCDGISHVYSKGIHAHRDVKPHNCLITSDGILKVTDFGLASVLDAVSGGDARSNSPAPYGDRTESPPRLTPTGAGLGTPAYMAPEQFSGAARVDARADVYAFGIMLYEMLTGELPFYGQSYTEWAHLHATSSVPHLPATFPGELDALIQRSAAKGAPERFRDFEDIRNSLAGLYETASGKLARPKATSAELDSAQWRRKGIGLTDLGHLAEALKCFEKSLACDSESSATWQCMGGVLTRMGRRTEALRCTERAVALDPACAIAKGSMAFELLGLGRPGEGLESATRAVELDPYNWNMWAIKAAVLNSLNRPGEAVFCCDRALKLNPNSDLTWAERSQAMRALGRTTEALDCANRAITLNGTCKDALRQKAEILIEAGRAHESIELLDRALSVDATSWGLWWDKGVALSTLKRAPEEQVECFSRCAELVPTVALFRYERGAALHELGRNAEALQSFEETLELDADYRDALSAKSHVLRDLGRAEEALVIHDRLIGISPNDASAWNDEGATLCALQRLDEARKCFNRALDIDPNHPLALHNRDALIT